MCKVSMIFHGACSPANFFSGILASIGPALAGSPHAFLPRSVIVTVGFMALTLIYCRNVYSTDVFVMMEHTLYNYPNVQ